MIRNDRPKNVASLSCMSSNVLTKMYFQNRMEMNCGCCNQYTNGDSWPRTELHDHSEKMFWKDKYAKEGSCLIKRHDCTEDYLTNPYAMKNSCQRIGRHDYTEREYLGRMKEHPSQRKMIENYLGNVHYVDQYVKEDRCRCHINRFEDYTEKAFLEDQYLNICPYRNRRPEEYDGKAYFVDQYMKVDPYRMLEDYTEKAFLKENYCERYPCQRQKCECTEKSMLGEYMVEDPCRRKIENDATNPLLKVQFENNDLYRIPPQPDFTTKLNKINFHSRETTDFFSENILNFNETLEEKSEFLEKYKEFEKYPKVKKEIDITFDLLSSNVKLIFENEVKPLEDLLKASLIRLAYLEWENKILKENVLPLNI